MPFPLRYTSLTIIRGKRHRLPPWSQLFIEGWVSTLGALGLRFDALARGPSRKCFMGPLHATKCLHFGHIPAAVVNLSPKRQKDMLFWWTFRQAKNTHIKCLNTYESQRSFLILPVSHSRLWPDPTVAVPAGAALGLQQRQLHHLGGHQWRVQAHRSRRGRPPMGRAEVQAQHELRQAQSRLEVSFGWILYFLEFFTYRIY